MPVETATLAGGCFWGMEDILRKISGVLKTRVGYTGGKVQNPTYEMICTGETGHAEALEIQFENTVLTYTEVLEKYFFRMHNPTTMNQQGNDVGSQYRSAIYFHTETQKQIAIEVLERVQASGFWQKPIVTEVTPASVFYAAEEYHQDYLEKNPGGYTCHYLR
ncbi:MAG: peptide-methionine (S)-S-oxide reductase MsrA [Bdellovibrio sp.]|jgi:methionine-S-sulfoxide reductase